MEFENVNTYTNYILQEELLKFQSEPEEGLDTMLENEAIVKISKEEKSSQLHGYGDWLKPPSKRGRDD